MEAVLDARCMQEREAAHIYLKEKLNFPDYYGGNLDALYDCLTDMDDIKVIIEHGDEAGEYFEKVYPVFLEACEDNPNVKVILIGDM